MSRTSKSAVRRLRPLAAALLAVTLAGPLACGDDSPDAVIGPPDTSLIGIWKGGIMTSVDDTPVTLTITLKADSTASAAVQGFDPACPNLGQWTVSGGRVTIAARNCRGGVVTFTAPIAGAHLIGTWSNEANLTGTFDVAKQQ
jgi:hypothetical protein